MKKIIVIGFSVVSSLLFAQTENVVVKKNLTLKDAVLKQYSDLSPKSIKDIKWISNTGNFSFQSDDMQTLMMQSSKGKSSEIITLEKLNAYLSTEFKHFYSLQWIDSENFLINSGVKYYTFNVKSKKGNLLAELPEGANNVDVNLSSSKIAYTMGKSLYAKVANNEVSVSDREHEEIVSGQAIARSEFGITNGTFWSEKGNFLAYYQKDETNVANYPLLDITTTPGDLNSIKYPMAGQESEMAKVGVYNFSIGKNIYLKTEGEKDQYLTNLSWSPDEKYVFIAVINRAQNHLKLNKYDAVSGDFVKTLFEEKNDKWVEPENPAYFISNSEFIWMSERDGFMNLYHYNTDGKLIAQLTKNKWVTTGILGYNKSKELFFTGMGDNPTEHHAFKVSIASKKQTQLTSEKGWHNVKYGEGGLVDEYSNTKTPRVVQLLTSGGVVTQKLLTAENPLKDYNIGEPDLFTIKSADGSTDLHCRMIKPSNFDEEKKYPVLVYVYGGPHAQLVTNSWLASAPLWMYYQAERDYIIFTVDNRGSANRGFEFESVIHRNLGDAEMEDQMKAVSYLKSLPYINPKRLAVHGWSFGGFMTTSLMLRQPGTFNVGVAGGPVTDWKYYEVMYGERYMDTPEENVDGYKKARLHNYTKDLKGKLLLIHGTIDDVVVMQHNLSLVQSFVDNEVQMDFFPYPMHPHNVRGKDRVHLMEKVLTYIEQNNKMGGMRNGGQGGPMNRQRLNNGESNEKFKEMREQRIKNMMQNKPVQNQNKPVQNRSFSKPVEKK